MGRFSSSFLVVWGKFCIFAANFKNKKTMFETMIGLVAFVAIALVGWAIAEAEAKTCEYEQNEEEKEVDKRLACQLHENGFHELNIDNVIQSISTKGFKTT